LVTSHYTLDKQNAAIREYLASKADFLGATSAPGPLLVRSSVILSWRPARAMVPASPGAKSMTSAPGWSGELKLFTGSFVTSCVKHLDDFLEHRHIFPRGDDENSAA
jgi:hypothetical protein